MCVHVIGMHACMYAHMHACMHACMYVYVCKCVCVYVCACVRVRVYVCMHVVACVYVSMCAPSSQGEVPLGHKCSICDGTSNLQSCPICRQTFHERCHSSLLASHKCELCALANDASLSPAPHITLCELNNWKHPDTGALCICKLCVAFGTYT